MALRIVGAILPLALLVHWSHGFSEYAAAMGYVALVAPLVSCGVEKSALLMLPRAAGRSRETIGAHLWLVAAVATSVLVVGGVVLASLEMWLVGLALLQAILLGVVQTQATLLRALGHTGPESAAIGGLSVGLLLGLVGVWTMGWGPYGLLAWWAGYLAAVAMALALRLRVEAPRRPDVELTKDVIGRAARLSLGDVSAAAGLSVVYVVLNASGHGVGLGRMYTVMAVVSLGLSALVYLTRLAAPELSRRRLSDAWYRQGLPVGRYVLPAGLSAVAVAGAASVHVAASSTEAELPLLAVMLAGVVPLLFVVLLAHFAFENGDRHTLDLTARYAVVSFAVTSMSAVALAWPLGAVGAVDALVAGELTHGLLLSMAARRFRSTEGNRP